MSNRESDERIGGTDGGISIKRAIAGRTPLIGGKRMDARHVTLIFLVIVLVAAGMYDVYASLMLPPGNTISDAINDISRGYPILPLLVGILIGHLFWAR